MKVSLASITKTPIWKYKIENEKIEITAEIRIVYRLKLYRPYDQFKFAGIDHINRYKMMMFNINSVNAMNTDGLIAHGRTISVIQIIVITNLTKLKFATI